MNIDTYIYTYHIYLLIENYSFTIGIYVLLVFIMLINEFLSVVI